MMDFLSDHAGLIGLLFFFIFFLGVLLWVYRPGTNKLYAQQAQIPLKEGADD